MIYDRSPQLETVIAHEIAHAYLGHSVTSALSGEEAWEREAREQTRAWGFRGAPGVLS